MHFKEAKGILSPQNGMNLYRGCTHGCIYCDSRSKCYHIEHDFEDVEVKSNAPELLEAALRKKRKKCMIGTGAMCDPYFPGERKLLHTRRCVELIEKYGFGLAVQTKSTLCLRDLDLFEQIQRREKCVVQITLTTFDEDLCRILEPHVSTTRERFEALCTLKEHGIPTVVWFSPLLPFLNDTEENLRGILSYCFEAGVKGILCFGIGVTMREGNREYFYQKLEEHFPGLRERYERCYGLRYELSSSRNTALMRIFHDECEKRGVMHTPEQVFRYLYDLETGDEAEQLSLFS